MYPTDLVTRIFSRYQLELKKNNHIFGNLKKIRNSRRCIYINTIRTTFDFNFDMYHQAFKRDGYT